MKNFKVHLRKKEPDKIIKMFGDSIPFFSSICGVEEYGGVNYPMQMTQKLENVTCLRCQKIIGKK